MPTQLTDTELAAWGEWYARQRHHACPMHGRSWKDVQMPRLARDVWLASSVLSPAQCAQLIESAEGTGFREARQRDTHGRHNFEVFLPREPWLSMIKTGMEASVRKEEFARTILFGDHRPVECYRYREGDHVTPHTDDPVEIAPAVMSTAALVIYLNDDFAGGDTSFPEVGLSVNAVRGSGLFFSSGVMHAGAVVSAGVKYIARTDIAFGPSRAG